MGTHCTNPDGILGGQYADALGSHGHSFICSQEAGQRRHLYFQVIQGIQDHLALSVVDIPAGAADGVHGVVHPVAGDGSNRSMVRSRSFQVCMNRLSWPMMWQAIPSHSRWEWIRSSSEIITRIYWPRLGTSMPAMFSTHIA